MHKRNDITLCPFCYRSYDTHIEWVEHFENNHPIWQFIDKYLPINTPNHKGIILKEMQEKTTRQRIEELLRERPSIGPSGIRDALSDHQISIELNEIIEQVEEINESTDEKVLVAPPECKQCGFDDYDDLANIPSKCPECKSEWIKEPQFTIQ